MLLSMIELEESLLAHRIKHHGNKGESAFDAVHEAIDEAFLVAKLKYACASINESRIRNREFPQKIVQDARQLLTMFGPCTSTVGQAYAGVFDLLSLPNSQLARFQAGFEFVARHRTRLETPEQLDLLNFIQNLCLRRIDLGDRTFELIAAKLYRYLLELDQFGNSGPIHPRTFKNIISLHARVQQFDFCESFIDKYGSCLPDSDRSFVVRYGMALLKFYRKEFKASAQEFRVLIDEAPKDLYWGFECRNLLMKSLFMHYHDLNMAEHDELQRLLESFRMYVNRNSSLSPSRKKSYYNFIHYFRIILRFKEGEKYSPEAIQKTIGQVEKEEFITHKNWILDVLLEFQKSR